MRKLILTAALALALPTASLADSLGGALASAYRNSGLLAQQRALLRAADEDVAAATAALRPVISYSLSGNYSSITQTTSSNLGLTAAITLFDGGSRALRRQVAQENVMSTREALRGVEQNVLLGAVSAYVAVLRDNAIVELRQGNLRLLEQQLQATRDRFDVGEVTRTDVSLAEARLASANSALAAARGALSQSRESYRAAVGAYPGRLDALPKLPATAKSLEEARAIARANHPDLAQAQRAVTVAELNVRLAEAAMQPVLSGNVTGNIAQGGQDSASFGLQLSGPIYQGGAIASSVRRAIAQRDAARAGLHLARINVDQAVGNAWAQLQVARAGLTASDEQIRAARVAFRGTREEAAVGSRTTLDVLNAEQELLDAEVARISAEADRQLAAYNLLSAMGLLTAQHLGLNVTTYDPAGYYEAVKSAPLTKVSPQGEKLDAVLKALGKQ